MAELRIVRLCCPSCGKRSGSIDRDADGELHFRWTSRTKMRGSNYRDARRWEYGTGNKGPREGPPPQGARIFKEPYDRHLWDPRRGEKPHLAHEDLEEDTIVYFDIKADDLHTWQCPRCGTGLRLRRSELAAALDDFDSSGAAVNLDMDPSPYG